MGGGVIKVVGGGLVNWFNDMIFILPVTKIFDKMYACNLVCGLE